MQNETLTSSKLNLLRDLSLAHTFICSISSVKNYVLLDLELSKRLFTSRVSGYSETGTPSANFGTLEGGQAVSLARLDQLEQKASNALTLLENEDLGIDVDYWEES